MVIPFILFFICFISTLINSVCVRDPWNVDLHVDPNQKLRKASVNEKKRNPNKKR